MRLPLPSAQAGGILWILFALFVPFTFLVPDEGRASERLSLNSPRRVWRDALIDFLLFVSFNYGIGSHPRQLVGGSNRGIRTSCARRPEADRREWGIFGREFRWRNAGVGSQRRPVQGVKLSGGAGGAVPSAER